MKEYLYRIYFIIAIITSLFYTSNVVDQKAMMLALIPFMIVVIAVVILIFKNKEYYKLKMGEIVLVTILICTYIVSSIMNKGFSFRELYSYGSIVIGIMLCGSIILSYKSKDIVKIFLETFVALSIAFSSFGLYCHYTKTEVYIGDKLFGYQKNFGNGTGGVLSIMQNVNSYALVCIVAIMISTILFFLYSNKVCKGLMVLNIVFQSYLLFIMGSRTTLVMLVSFIGFYFIFFFKSKYKKYLYFIGIILLIGLLAIVLTGNVPRESALWYKMISGDITSGRLDLWKAAFKGIKENILFGVGIRNVIQTIGINMGNLENTLGAHNGYISVLLSNGIFVFASVICLIIYYIKESWKKIKFLNYKDKIVNQLMICFCLTMLVGNLTESLLFGDFNFATTILWIMLIIASKYNCNRVN